MSLIDPFYGTQPTVPTLDGFGYVEFPDAPAFSQRSASGYQESLEEILRFLKRRLIPYLIQSNPQNVWDTNVNALIAAVNAALVAQTASNAAAIQAAINAIANSEIVITDPAILAVLNQTNTATRMWFDAHYSPKTLTTGDNIADVVLHVAMRLAEFFVSPMDFGAVGDGAANDTLPVQNAVAKVLAATDPANVQQPKANGLSFVLWIPLGTFLVDTIHVPGSIVIKGAGTFAYASATLRQRTAGQPILRLEADTDNTSNATQIESVCFRSGMGTSDGNAALIKTAPGIGSNSVYIRKCWFATPERYSIWITQGDDIKIMDCTFDVSAFHAIKIGDTNSSCSNVQIHDNTFYDIALRHIDLMNVRGISIQGNKAYKGSQAQPSVFIETADAQHVSGVTVLGGTIDSIRIPFHIFAAPCRAISITGVTITGNFDSALVVEGGSGDILQAFGMNDCTIDNANAMDGGSAFRCQVAAMQASTITGNRVVVQNATALVFNMPNPNTSNNNFQHNPNINFSNYSNFAAGTNNSI